MPAYSCSEVPLVFEAPGMAYVRQVATEGGMTIEFTRLEAGVDPADAFRGLPDDMCQAGHYGFVMSGSMVYRTAGGEEIVVRAGDAYYIPPGHLPLTRDEACEVVEFTDTHELAETMAVVARNLESAGAR